MILRKSKQFSIFNFQLVLSKGLWNADYADASNADFTDFLLNLRQSAVENLRYLRPNYQNYNPSYSPNFQWSIWQEMLKICHLVASPLKRRGLGGGFLITFIFLFQSCYSFRGISIDPTWKTFYVSNFQMQTSGGPANLPLTMTEKLREYFQRNTSLKVNSQSPDLLFEGTITAYETAPQAPTSSDKAGLNRLLIKMQVKLTNAKNEEKGYDQEFSFYIDFPQNQTLNQVEKDLYPRILDKIIEDIFNKTAGDW